MSKNKEVLQTEKQFLKDEIVHTASRMIKDHDDDIRGGMTEIAAKWINELDALLFRLDQIDKAIADCDIKR